MRTQMDILSSISKAEQRVLKLEECYPFSNNPDALYERGAINALRWVLGLPDIPERKFRGDDLEIFDNARIGQKGSHP